MKAIQERWSAAVFLCLVVAVLPGCGSLNTNEPLDVQVHRATERFIHSSLETIKEKLATNDEPRGNDESGDNGKPKVFVQIGHADAVHAVAFSPDGRWALSGSMDETVKLWEVATGREVRTFPGNDGVVMAVAFSPDGRWALTGSGKLKLWEVATGRKVRTFAGHGGAISTVAFSPDGRMALSGSWDKTVRLWEVETGRELRTFTADSMAVRSVAFSPDGQWALSGGMDRTLKLWEVATGRLVRTFTGHTEDVKSVAFSSDGQSVLSGSQDKTVRLWDMATGRGVRTFSGHANGVSAVAFSPNGQWALSTDSMAIRMWEVATGNERRTLTGHGHLVWAVTFSPDGQWALSGSQDKTLRLWEVGAGREVRTFGGAVQEVHAVAFSPDGQSVLSGGFDRTLRLWDAGTGRLVRTFNGHTGVVWSAAFSPDGRWLLSGGFDKFIRLWDVATGREVRTFTGYAGEVQAVAFSPNGKWVLSGGHDRILRLWDVATGRLVRTFTGHTEVVFSVAFSPDGRWVVSGSADTTIRLWDVGTGRAVWTSTGPVDAKHSRYSVAFSPDGRWVLGGLDKTVRLWEVATGREVRTYSGVVDPIQTVAFSPDGRWALAGSLFKTVQIWEVTTGREVRTFSGHTGGVWSVAYSPDGQLALSGGEDGSNRIWRVTDGQELVKMVGFTDGEWISSTPKGYYTGSDQGAKHLNVRIGNQVYGMDNFFEQFYRPDVVAEVLRTREPDASVLAKLGEKERVNLAQAVKPPPSVRFLSPKPGESFDKDDIEVSVQATDQGGGVNEIRLFHNGKVVGAETRDLIVTGKTVSDPGLTKAYRVRLVEGANVFRAVAFSTDRIESNPDELTIQLKAVGKAATLHLLLVGINEYKNSSLNLNYALPDVQGMQKFFAGASSRLFKEVKRYELYDKDATKAAILAKLQELHASAPQDVVVIYLAGHGESLENIWYFIPHEIVTPENDERVKQQGLSSIELKDQVSQIGAQKVVVLIDACKSGSAMEAFATRGLEDRKAMAQLARSTGTHIVAASTKDQFAAEVKELGHGVFTYTLLDGLSGKADSNPKDGTITVRELLTYVENRLPEVSEQYKQQAQYPVVDSRGQDFPLALMR